MTTGKMFELILLAESKGTTIDEEVSEYLKQELLKKSVEDYIIGDEGEINDK